MALVKGTNFGFVTTAPTADPSATTTDIDYHARIEGDTSPATAIKIVEIGWWCDTATEESNFEVGLYAADGATVPGEAGTRLYVDDTNAKGTTAGWKSVAVDWVIDPNTKYWISVQLDDTATTTNIDYSSTTGGSGSDVLHNVATLPSPFGGGAFATNINYAIYAVWEAEAPAGTNMTVNVDDVAKDIATAYVNVDDVWKEVASAVVNVDDVWKTIY